MCLSLLLKWQGRGEHCERGPGLTQGLHEAAGPQGAAQPGLEWGH